MINIKQYEAMAKLDLSDGEREIINKRANILEDSFQALTNIDTGDTAPLVTVLDLKNVLREDVNIKAFTREEILSNAPEQYDGYFQVPKTLD